MNIQSLALMLGRVRRKLPGYFASTKAPKGFPSQGPRVIITLAADYPNLGDVAITQSVIEFCRRHLPSHHIFVIPAHQTLKLLKGTAQHTEPMDVVVIVGGGNMGDRYRRLEELRCTIVESFPKQRIISFPQSCEFKNPGAEDYSRRVYATHRRLTLCARDNASYERMRRAFPATRVIRAPDTVLLLAPTKTVKKIGPLICLRTDQESKLGGTNRNTLVKALTNLCPTVLSTDTIAQNSVENYPNELQRLFETFSQASVVVTDRLHGLIFAKIHQKPCVVIEGANDKLRAFVDTWMSAAQDICLVDSPNAQSIYAAVERVTFAPAAPAIDSNLFKPLVLALKDESILAESV